MKLLSGFTSYRNHHIETLIQHHQANDLPFDIPGVNAVIHAFFTSNILGYTVLMVQTMPNAKDFGDFIYTVLIAGIDEMLLCDESTDVMKNLIHLLENGWQITGPFEDSSHGFPIRGLRLKKG